MKTTPGITASLEELNARSAGRLPGLLGVEVTAVESGNLTSRLVLKPEHLAPNGYLHAASAVALADTTCGYGAIANMPDGGSGFTTIELKSNFIGTARSGTIVCQAKLVHGGKSTQVWDAQITDETSGRVITLFRCTQMILYPPVEK
jgi:1,4-dihydroxy-2-naphthoyl-CoA hydrolase